LVRIHQMADQFYAALNAVLDQKGMSVAELAGIPGASNLSYRVEQRSPWVTLRDVYAVSRALGVVPLVAVKEGEPTKVIHIEDNAAALRELRGEQTVGEHIRDTGLPYSAYYEMQSGSRPELVRVINVWGELGYNLKFFEPAPVSVYNNPKTVNEISLPNDFMKLNQDQVTELLRRHFPNK